MLGKAAVQGQGQAAAGVARSPPRSALLRTPGMAALRSAVHPAAGWLPCKGSTQTRTAQQPPVTGTALSKIQQTGKR